MADNLKQILLYKTFLNDNNNENTYANIKSYLKFYTIGIVVLSTCLFQCRYQ